MGYVLDGTSIRRPNDLIETNDTQVAQQRTLSGAINRDYFGSNKRRWVLQYRNTNKTDYDVIKAKHTSYLSDAVAKTWEITETNYDVDQTNVHIDLQERGFSVKGTDYISDFDLILTEA